MRMLVFIIAFALLGTVAYAQNACSFQGKEVEVEGRVIEVKPPVAIIEVPSGDTLAVRLGPYRYWIRMGYKLYEGDRIYIKGYRCGDIIFPVYILRRREKIILRDKRGVPIWRKFRRHRRW